MVTVYDKQGNSLLVHPIDARELCKSGEYFETVRGEVATAPAPQPELSVSMGSKKGDPKNK